jgi:hypothetical protein
VASNVARAPSRADAVVGLSAAARSASEGLPWQSQDLWVPKTHATWAYAPRTGQSQVLARRQQLLGNDHPDTQRVANNLLSTLKTVGDHETALTVLANLGLLS